MEVQRASLVLANRLVIELARDVARDVAHDEPHDLVVDAALAPRRPSRESARRSRPASVRAPLIGGRSTSGARRRQRVKGVLARLEIALDESLALRHAVALFASTLAPRVERSCSRSSRCSTRSARLRDRRGSARARRSPTARTSSSSREISMRGSIAAAMRRQRRPAPRRAATSTLKRAAGSASSDGLAAPGTSGTASTDSRARETTAASPRDRRRASPSCANSCRMPPVSVDARRVVIAGDEHDLRVRQRASQPRELQERVEDRLVRRPHRVKHVAGDDDDVRRERDDAVDGRAKGRGDVRLPLVDAAGSQPLILPVAEVEIGEMDQAHAAGVERRSAR